MVHFLFSHGLDKPLPGFHILCRKLLSILTGESDSSPILTCNKSAVNKYDTKSGPGVLYPLPLAGALRILCVPVGQRKRIAHPVWEEALIVRWEIERECWQTLAWMMMFSLSFIPDENDVVSNYFMRKEKKYGLRAVIQGLKEQIFPSRTKKGFWKALRSWVVLVIADGEINWCKVGIRRSIDRWRVFVHPQVTHVHPCSQVSLRQSIIWWWMHSFWWWQC